MLDLIFGHRVYVPLLFEMSVFANFGHCFYPRYDLALCERIGLAADAHAEGSKSHADGKFFVEIASAFPFQLANTASYSVKNDLSTIILQYAQNGQGICMSDAVASSEPVIAPLPTPISVEPRVAPAEAAEIARQAEEAKLPKDSPKAAEPKGDEPKKPLSARDALRAAREKVEAGPTTEKASPIKTEPKAAEPVKAEPAAKAEPVKAAEPKAADTKEPAKGEPARDADGKFVSSDPAKAAAEPKAAEPAAPAPKAALPSHTAEPAPARFSAAAKEKWAEAPDEVRAEVTRAVTELTKGFEKHREAAARDADLTEFHEMAARGKTTVKEALSKYTSMENLLRSDPDKGIEAIFQNIGISPREWAAKILNQAPDATASKADATILELRRELAEIKQGLGTLHQEREQTRTQSTTDAVTKFAADHPRFEELSEDIAFFLKTRCPGDLPKAYELAERLNPAHAKVEPEPKPAPAPASEAAPVPTKPTLVHPAAQTDDRGQKSITGAPSAGSDPARKQPSSSIKEAIRKARAAAG